MKIASKFLLAAAASLYMASANAGQSWAADKVAIMPFTGPTKVSIDDDIVWKMKTGNSAPSKEEMANIPRLISTELTKKLSTKLGKIVVTQDELNKAMDEAGLATTTDKEKRDKDLAKRLDAAYILNGSVDYLQFDGNTVLNDKYAIYLSAKLMPTGENATNPTWKAVSRKFYKKVKAAKGRSVASVFAEEQVPEIADALASEIAAALGR